MNLSNEINNLAHRRIALHEYLKTEQFKNEPPEMQNWARMQEGAMEQYARALQERQRLAPAGYLDSGNNAPVTAPAAQQPVQEDVPINHPAYRKPAPAPKRKAVARKAPVVAVKATKVAAKQKKSGLSRSRMFHGATE